MIFLRTWRGIATHFPDRAHEWAMGGAALSMYAVLTIQPDMFSLGPHYATAASWASEQTWALAVLWAGVFRLFALGINGTFDSFRYSPHLRAAAAFVGLVFWAMFALAAASNWWQFGTTAGPIVAYGTASVIEAVNTYRSSKEVGYWFRRRSDASLG